MSTGDLLRRVRRRLRRELHRVGIDVRRYQPPKPAVAAPPPSDLYLPTPTCQIPNLGLVYELYFGRRVHGCFVEVGGYDGITYSNTSCLADVGWSGLIAEPIPEFAEQCRRRYAERPDVRIAEVAIGSSAGELELNVGDALTTAVDELYDEYLTIPVAGAYFADARRITVPQQTLDHCLAEHGVEPGFELLVVDVEGFEAQVFAGFDLERWRPQMLIVELADVHPQLTATRDEHAWLSRRIVGAGYVIVFKDVTNTIFVTEDVFAAAHQGGTR